MGHALGLDDVSSELEDCCFQVCMELPAVALGINKRSRIKS